MDKDTLLEQLKKQVEALENTDDFIEFPYTIEGKNGSKKPELRIDNTKAVFDHYSITVRYNEMSKDVEIVIPDEKYSDDTELNAKLISLQDRCAHHGYKITKPDLDGHIVYIANKNTYHPVRKWISSMKWDGVSRFQDLLDTVESTSPLKELLFKRWLTSCVAAVFNRNGIASQGMLVFVGKQGLGKTTWIKKLVGIENAVKEGAMLDPSNKDMVLEVVKHWIVELGELGSTFRKADLDNLKAFITKEKDSIRPPYAAKVNQYARRSIFFGTVNDDTFLIDNENRRFWNLNVTELNAFHDIDVQQLWAEVYQWYVNGERSYLDREEQVLLQESNKSFESIDYVIEKLERSVKKPDDLTAKSHKRETINTTAILEKLGYTQPTRADLNKAARWLRDNNFTFIKFQRRFEVVICADDLEVIRRMKDRIPTITL